MERRVAWFEQFALTGRYRLVVAEENGMVVGYAGTTRFRVKPAYDTTVETTVYSSSGNGGQGNWQKALRRDYLKRWPERTSIALLVDTRCRMRRRRSCMRCSASRTVGIFSEVGYKFGKYWDVAWTERPCLRISTDK